MFVTEEQAAEIYAKACRCWYGAKATSVVRSNIKKLMARGDRKGVKAWQQVARALEALGTETAEDADDPQGLSAG